MYTSRNFKTKAALKLAIAAGEKVTVYQPNGDITGAEAPLNGTVYLEGPHYPQPHKWCAQGRMVNGVLDSVK